MCARVYEGVHVLARVRVCMGAHAHAHARPAPSATSPALTGVMYSGNDKGLWPLLVLWLRTCFNHGSTPEVSKGILTNNSSIFSRSLKVGTSRIFGALRLCQLVRIGLLCFLPEETNRQWYKVGILFHFPSN